MNDPRLKKIVIYENEKVPGSLIYIYEAFEPPPIGAIFNNISEHPYEVFKVQEVGKNHMGQIIADVLVFKTVLPKSK